MSIATFFVLTRVALRTARATRRDALCACGLTAGATDRRRVQNEAIASPASQNRFEPAAQAQSCALPTWWFWRGGRTRSHSEHGRETPQRRWYFVLRRGRVGRCQVCKTQDKQNRTSSLTSRTNSARFCFAKLARFWLAKLRRDFALQNSDNAGWSSPVARQAHNLKAAGSNPAPATNDTRNANSPTSAAPTGRLSCVRKRRWLSEPSGSPPPVSMDFE